MMREHRDGLFLVERYLRYLGIKEAIQPCHLIGEELNQCLIETWLLAEE